MKYYKLIQGFENGEYIQIDETELEKAYYCFLEKKDAIYSGGAIRGSQISAIKPDYHRAMGWTRGYKLGVDDYTELSRKGIDREHMHYLAEVKTKVQDLIQSGRVPLIENLENAGKKN